MESFYYTMKQFVVAALFTLFAFSFRAKAQDVIVKKDASSIVAKVLSISETEVEYKTWDNLEGPTYKISIGSLMSISYQNGKTETFGTTIERSPLVLYQPPYGDRPITKIYADGNELHDSYSKRELSDDNALQLLGYQDYYNYIDAKEAFQCAKSDFIAGGVLLGTGAPVLIAGLVISREMATNTSNAMCLGGGAFSLFGVLGLAMGTAFRAKAIRRMNDVVNRFNSGQGDASANLSFDLTENGYGLVLRF